jgi:hypothetical protein
MEAKTYGAIRHFPSHGKRGSHVTEISHTTFLRMFGPYGNEPDHRRGGTLDHFGLKSTHRFLHKRMNGLNCPST